MMGANAAPPPSLQIEHMPPRVVIVAMTPNWGPWSAEEEGGDDDG